EDGIRDRNVTGVLTCALPICSLYRLSSLLYQVMGQFIEFCFCQVHIQMLRSICCCCDERKVDVCCGRAGQLFLSFLSCLTDTLHSHLVIGQIYTFLFLELGQEDRKSTRLNSSHVSISYAVFCLKKKTIKIT